MPPASAAGKSGALSTICTLKLEDVWLLEEGRVKVLGKGAKERRAPFTQRTATLLREYMDSDECKGDGINIWHLNTWGITSLLRHLHKKTGLPCNPYTFRRTFASNLHRAGLDVEHIMRLGGWESLDMVLRYTQSVKFEKSLRLYRGLEE